MFRPIKDIIRYINIFQIYLGIRMYLIYGLGIIASILEGFGILMLLPLLQTIDANAEIDKNENLINQILYGIINSLGLSESITSILIIISLAFILKGAITFLSLGFTAY